MKGASFLNDALMDPVSASSMSPDDAPFRHAYGAPIFDYYSQVRVFPLRNKDCALADRFGFRRLLVVLRR